MQSLKLMWALCQCQVEFFHQFTNQAIIVEARAEAASLPTNLLEQTLLQMVCLYPPRMHIRTVQKLYIY